MHNSESDASVAISVSEVGAVDIMLVRHRDLYVISPCDLQEWMSSTKADTTFDWLTGTDTSGS